MSQPSTRRLAAELTPWELPWLPWASFHATTDQARTPEKMIPLNNATCCLFGFAGDQLPLEDSRHMNQSINCRFP